ncbi:MAG: double-strand break repair protein AddB, partial [Alphaproteobacteria bacterium]|nr:double-strand break repair protein AddB [Alphaproteobacteria bacterium]
QHPQFGLKRLLEKMKIERSDVPSWPGPAPSARLAALSFALRPAAATEAWRERAPDPDGYAGLSRLDAPTPREEAAAIALLMREALETPGKRAALITPDRGLARRVAAELLRWDIAIDDSAGTPLGQTPPGIFFRLIAAAAVEPGDPHVLLSLLQHPFCRLGLPAATHKALLHRFDAELRGPRPGDDLAAYRRIVESDTELAAWADAWIGALTPLVTAIQAGAEGPAILAVHRRAAETLAREEGADAARLYAGEDGHALAAFIDDLAGLADLLPRPSEASWAALIDELMAGRVVRPRFGTHPRLAILGPLEARLQQVERVILGGLNEGTWPADPGVDPWMSRPMRARFGLPESERRIGLAAHDFVAFAAAPEAILTRGLKVDGAPTVPSRWLLRLEAACGPIPSAMDWVERARLLDHVPISRPCLPPAPRPPVSARPPGLSVTDIETWMRNPYAIHARHILRLSALDPIDQDPGRAELGSFVHRALAAFLGAVQESWPEDALAVLLREGERAFGSSLARPGIRAFWWPRFVRIAAWVVATEMERRPGSWPIAWERKGSLALGDFTLRARADRIDRLAGGGIALIDYKTGTPPKKEDIARGFSPQLPLEGLIAEAGGFTGVDRATVGELAIWHLQGGAEAGKIIPVDGPDGAIARARAGLAALIAKFADPATPYLAVPRRAHRPRYDDYAHLARIAEWSDEVTP